jgi:hypothetical protein
MKNYACRLSWFALVAILLSIVASPSASGLFGLGACEKVKKSIIAEEKIGLESWNTYRTMALRHNQDPKWNVDIAMAILEVYRSDKIIWQLAQKNPKCYTSKQNSTIRLYLSLTNKDISTYQANLKSQTFPYFVYTWSNIYNKYWRAYDILNSIK